MPATTILLIILALVLAGAISFFQYFFRAKGSRSRNSVFAFLRFLSLFLLFLLLINPQIKNEEYYTEKPHLVLAVDNSGSVAHFKAEEEVRQLVDNISQHEQINERFDVEIFTFGNELKKQSDLTFEERQSNIPAVFRELNKLYENSTAPTILITDGNQTLGEDLTFSAQRYRQPLMPVVVGDTTSYQDLAISRINVNKYAFLENRFPVEIMVSYSGKTGINTRVTISSGKNVIFKSPVSLSPQNNSAVLRAEIPASSVGVRTFEAKIEPLNDEKNVQNNTKEFAVEVIDERTSILLAYEVLHPDLGAVKKSIEANQQREVSLRHINTVPADIEQYQLVILYQPTESFKLLLDELKKKKRNHWFVTGPLTNWRFLNGEQETHQQEITGQTEEFFPVLNSGFRAFQAEDIGFDDFPPLQGNFGQLTFPETTETLLFRKIQGMETQIPMLCFTEQDELKTAFLFGADIWKWRSRYYQENETFAGFDEFMGKIVQYLSSGKRKERLTIEYEPVYDGSVMPFITAEYFDKNYIFDDRGRLTLTLKEEGENEERKIPFLLRENRYTVDLGHLSPGEYSFSVSVAGENLRRSGKFRLLSFDVESQFTGANLQVLKTIAEQKDQELYFLGSSAALIENLLSSNSYLPVQKKRENTVPLIDWYYLLAIIILSLSIEWFLRKYYGHI
ncbi:vWA domain-containing protein [Salinimicrobium flavum]|uniref:VWA domain-containing protein n=1 Tax=Salinimicrobium flavum TaxID=1737065 RepID=A0ABW5IYM1_9FLAO